MNRSVNRNRDPDLPEGERSRLKANLKWMMAVRPDLSLLRRHLRNASNETSHEMGQIALSIAASDGSDQWKGGSRS